MKITWDESALVSYEKTILFILEKWPVQVAEELEQSVNELLDNIAQNNAFCPPLKGYKKLRRCVVSKQTSLIYEVKKEAIHLLLFVDNRSNYNF